MFSEGAIEGVFRGGNRVCFQVVIACVSSIYFRGNSKCLQGGLLVVDVFRRTNSECFHEG